MPKIPRPQQRAEFPGTYTSPEKISAPIKAAAGLGEQVAGMMADIAERDRLAEIDKQALKAGNAIRDEQDAFAESLSDRADYENFSKDVDDWEKRTREKYQPMSKTMDGRESPKLAQAIDAVISNRSTELKKLARDKARVMFTDEAKGEWVKSQRRYAEDYVAEEDPDKKAIIKNNMEIEARELASRGILWHKDAETDIQQFDALVKKTLQQNEEARARKAIYLDPEAAIELLADSKSFPDLDPTRRVQLMEHAEVRMRLDGARKEKLTQAIWNENRARALDDFADGRLDLDRLKQYRAVDPETGQRGLSDEFFSSMMEKIRQGKDSPTDPDTFNRLYLKDDLTWRDVDRESDKLSEKDTRTLLSRILQERREDVRESRMYRKEREAEERREKAEERRIAKEEERITRDRRNAYADVAKAYIKKAMNEMSMSAEDGVAILKTFQGYIDDKNIASEDLPNMADKLLESKRGGVIKWIKGLLGTRKEEIAPPPISGPAPAGRPQRRSLDEIFGTKKP